MDQDNLKCLYRKAKCLAHLGDHQESLKLFEALKAKGAKVGEDLEELRMVIETPDVTF